MRKFTYSLMLFTGIFFISCSSDDDGIDITTCADGVMNGDETGVDCGGSCAPCETAIENPTNYVFTRDGQNTVSFDGQTTRIKMGQELLSNFNVPTNSLQKLTGMFAHEEGADDFEDASLNASDKSLRSKVAASADYFSTNATDQALIRTKVDGFISAQVNEVYPNWEVAAAAGTAG